MKIHSVEVLNHCLFQRKPVINVVLDEDRHNLQSSNTCRSPATLSRNQFVLILLTFNRTDNNWLEHSEFSNRRSQRLKALVTEGLTGLKGIRAYCANGHPSQRTFS
jgi:hypothetical protein